MATGTKTIEVAPDSEVGLLLEEVGGAPVILEKDGERYLLAREDTLDIWAGYDPDKVREALRQSAGALAASTGRVFSTIYMRPASRTARDAPTAKPCPVS